jgi:hypothetical protein
VLGAAQFVLKQAAVPVTITGLEKLQNSGKEEMIDLMSARLDVAEATLANIITQGCYGDGTAWSGKSLVGLDAAVEATATASQTSTYGGISRTLLLLAKLLHLGHGDHQHRSDGAGGHEHGMGGRGARGGSAGPRDHGHELLERLDGFLQAIQRFTTADTSEARVCHFPFMNMDIYLDGGVGGFAGSRRLATEGTFYLLNSKFLKFRPHKDRNFVPLSPERRYAVNQDVEVAILAFAGALTCSGARYSGRVKATTV